MDEKEIKRKKQAVAAREQRRRRRRKEAACSEERAQKQSLKGRNLLMRRESGEEWRFRVCQESR